MNKIKEGAINKSDIVTGTTEANRTNIVNFLRAAGEYGVPAKYLFEVEDLLSLSRISRVTRCLYVLAVLASKDFAYHGPKMSSLKPRERKPSVPEGDRAKLANVNISNIFWNLMEDAERRKNSHE